MTAIAALRRTALAAAGVLVATSLISPATAGADTNYVELVRVLNGNVKTMDCNALRTVVRGTGLADENTTRSQFVGNVNKAVGEDAALRLVAAPTVNTLGDRALECGVVKPDQATPLSQAIAMSSQMSSQAGLPEIRNLLPAVAAQ
ncbi:MULTISPECIES: hypothetical protein [Corynebacterium]|uniref:hypothetical protein n=1 Tax=Corynebacterium TaxID=1716 RepID=UPI001E53B4FD|nr:MULTISPECIES: hypothetical protein [Corynebacterium]MCG7255315.1 hypothetical protein [Corynebacterium hadale]MCG7257649.1 hypothetical protein [Corynebacterium hadale]MCG7266340.1 hypothetical protein [Corynebacterium hadale]WJZ13653.1 Alpha helical Porin B [Corynebacterium gottingense]WJZ15968.1 Alpha helical Porin B [Corynebacterium gottingense]